MPPEEKSRKQQQEEWDYIGNVWGWKFSFIGLAVIAFLFAVIFFRWHNLEHKPANIFVPKNQPIDSLEVDSK